jgi:phosphonatase-like hydrolase
MKPQLIIFDLAGTTVKDNRDVHRVLQLALAEHGVEISLNDANEVMGIPKPVAIESLLIKRHLGRKPISESWILEIHELFVAKMKEFYLNDPQVRENDGVSETFAQLKSKGIKVVVDTGFDRPITTPLLMRMGWVEKGLLDFSVTSDEVPRGRPYPDMIHKAMSKFGITDTKMVAKIGDTPSDMMEGTSAKCGWVIGITSGAFSRDQLVKERHTHLVDTIPQVLQVLNLE